MSLIVRALTFGAATLFAASARADRSFSIAGLAGYGGETQTIVVGGMNAYRLGVGVRAAITSQRVHVGLTVLRHFGTHESAFGEGTSYTARYSTTLAGAELGYEAPIGRHVSLRPFVGAGLLFASGRTSVLGQTVVDDHVRLHVTPGLAATYRVGGLFFGPELRVVASPLEQPRKWGVGLYGAVGYAF